MDWYELVRTELGYEPVSTFWTDFSIADKFGADAVEDTFKRAFDEWKTNYKYLTELVMVLNHKLGYWYGKDYDLCNVYERLWNIADAYGCDNLEGDELSYFYKILD